MNAILLRTAQQPLLSFSDYREAEQALGAKGSSVTANGALLEYETLELRIHPPNVNIDNETYADRTLITLDSANRPGTLVEVVQLLTELGLCVIKARISSDGGWFVDEFSVTDAGKKVSNERKLRAIRKVLSVDADPGSDSESAGDSVFEEAAQCSTVFELAGDDRIGLLADVIALLKDNGCEVRSAAVWTHNSRCAFVISVLDAATGSTIRDGIKLQRLHQLLLLMMEHQNHPEPSSNSKAALTVSIVNTKGLIHYERRLHQLLLKEEEAQWRQQAGLAAWYEQEIAEQQAQQERRWTGPSAPAAASGAAGAAGCVPVSGGWPAAAKDLGSGAGRSRGTGVISQAQPSTGAHAGAPTSSATAAATLPSHAAILSTATPAAAAAAAAAAHVRVSTGSPTMGSPEGSTHGGACCAALANGNSSTARSGAADCAGKGQMNRTDGGGGNAAGSYLDVGANPVCSVPSAMVSAMVSGSTAASSTADCCSSASSSSPPSCALPAAVLAAPPSPSPPVAPPASSAQKPEVWVRHTKQHNYWTVNIRCRDRQKLLFDTVCTLAELNYDVYHGAVDCEMEKDSKSGAKVSVAVQTFYMRPRYGDATWDPKKAAKLKYMLECAIQRRQPQGTKVHIQGTGAQGGGAGGGGGAVGAMDLPALTAVWRKFGLCITRAKVRALAGSAGEHTFYLVDNDGRPPADTLVQQACQQIGGVRLAKLEGVAAVSAPGGMGRSEGGKFGFTVYSRPVWMQGNPSANVPDSI